MIIFFFQAWADRASKHIPGHPAIFDLQVRIVFLCQSLVIILVILLSVSFTIALYLLST